MCKETTPADQHCVAGPIIIDNRTMKEENDDGQQQQQQKQQQSPDASDGPIETDVSNNKNSFWPEEEDESLTWFQMMYRRWTFSYMNKIFEKGAKQMLEGGTRLCQEDLYPVPESMKAAVLSEQFREFYKASKGSKRRLMVTLWHLSKPTFVPAGFCELGTVICQVGLPLCVQRLLDVLEQHPYQKAIRPGLPWSIAICLLSIVNGFFNQRHRHLAMKTGAVMRAAVVTVLYEHVLELTPRGRIGLTSGEVTNLVATDTQKLYEVAQEAHLIWALPLAIILVTSLLIWIIGPVALVGILVLMMFVPIVHFITAKMLSIRAKRVKMTDARIGLVNAMLQGIKVTKLNNYEEKYEARVQEARNKELFYLRREMFVWASTMFCMVVSPVLATTFTFVVHVLVDENNILTAGKSFSVLLLFAALRFPINFFGRLVGRAAQALSAIDRLTKFLKRETRKKSKKSEDAEDMSTNLDLVPLALSRASFRLGGGEDETEISSISFRGFSSRRNGSSHGDESTKGGKESSGNCFTASEFNLSVLKGEVLAVCGPVGCGKSTLIQGIIDEVPPADAETKVTTNGVIAYVPQSPFIVNATLRENIIFGRPFNQALYDRVIDACCLRPDIEQIGPSRDLTEIGERGVTLSGGQKQRVSLARASYAQPDLVLLDDPLSALDAGTAKQVFERLIKAPTAFFAETAVVLVTHASHFLNRVDYVMVMVDGKNQFLGNWEELSNFQPQDPKTQGAIDFIRSSVQEHDTGNHGSQEEKASASQADSESKIGALMTIEQREHGLSSLRTWLLWFKHAGGFSFVLILYLCLFVDRAAYVGVEYWLARWTEGAYEPVDIFGRTFPAQTDGREAQYNYVVVYLVILLVSNIGTFLRSEFAVTGGSRASKVVFFSMLSHVLKAPLSYFETTPMGRVLNRFTYDTEVIDVLLTQNMSMLLIAASWYFAGIAVMISIIPYTAFVIFPTTVYYLMLLLHYRKSGADLQRLDAVSRSPIAAKVSEGLDGSSTIRVFKRESIFIGKFRTAVDDNASALLNFLSAQRWLGLRIELIGSSIILVSTVLVATMNDVLRLDPGIVGLLIVWSANFTITLGVLIDTFGEAEAAITAIERVEAMSQLPQEKDMETKAEFKPSPSWPEQGCLEFDRVSLRYRKGLPLALDNLTFKIPAGKRCGVVGRTGAGKSSLTVALFRLVEIEAGHVFVDGVDLANLGLSDVRGRTNGMTIIPQDPFLTGTTLRECLDPFGQNKDSDIVNALEAVRLIPEGGKEENLDMPVQEGGSNFSVGERQLLNLARALLSKPKILVLDEATASIDGETDAFIQKMLRTRFSGTTVISVAHRLGTIMDSDLILVMDKGRAVELGTPSTLLQDGGIFSTLVDATGPEGSKALRSMVIPT